MGSKRKLAPKILDYIIEKNPECKYFYDLFGGGGSISFEALQRREIKKVTYNELNTGVVNLLKDIRDNGVRDEYYQWVSRETFLENKDEDDWFSGLVKTCWSFGNNAEKGYLYGKDSEYRKKELFNTLLLNYSNNDLQFGRISSLKAERVEHLERLQHLESLQHLDFTNLFISNQSYQDVEISTPINETIIYLDPPYQNTGTYQLDIDHNELMEYIKQSPYKIYVSSYDFNLPCVYEMKHRSILSATANNEVVEKLFCNREEQYDTFLDYYV